MGFASTLASRRKLHSTVVFDLLCSSNLRHYFNAKCEIKKPRSDYRRYTNLLFSTLDFLHSPSFSALILLIYNRDFKCKNEVPHVFTARKIGWFLTFLSYIAARIIWEIADMEVT
ncbi:hypothetical protein CFREI_03290 [Corynebacterium freiburgense]|nr:hypothetical protein CFREI_03290 [Corynebacterium freiburgense]